MTKRLSLLTLAAALLVNSQASDVTPEQAAAVAKEQVNGG